MLNNKLLYFSATIALCGGLTSCAVDACSFDSDYKKDNPAACMPPAIIDTGLSVIPKRISLISGGTLLIADKQNPGTEVYLSKAGELIPIGHLSEDGELQHIITPSELAKLSLGEIKLELKNATVIRNSLSIRAYSEPRFLAKIEGTDWKSIPTTQDINASEQDTPVMIGITPEPSILLLNHIKLNINGVIKQTTKSYSADLALTAKTNNLGISLDAEISSNGYTGFSQSRNGILFNGLENKNPPSSVSRFDSFVGNQVTQGNLLYKPHKATSFLCSDTNGKITGAVIDGLLSFFDGQSLDKPIKMNHGANNNASISTLKFGIGDLDGDQYPDVAIWHNLTNTISVYTLKGNILEWSPTLSIKLQAKSASVLGQNFPSAVRLADIDRDGVDDIVLADRERLIILPNDGTGDYEESIEIPAIGSEMNALGPISAIAIGQLGNNPKSLPSLALVSSQAKKIAVVLNQSTE